MILVTVGTEKFAFNRLMQWIENLIEQNFINLEQEEVVIQYGSCTILPKGAKSYALLPESEFQNLLAKARVVIAHCGEGTLDLLATTQKPFILVPRSHQFGEHVDNHQVELAESLAAHNVAIAYNPEDLTRFLETPQSVEVKMTPSACYTRASQLLETEFATTSHKPQSVFSFSGFINNVATVLFPPRVRPAN